MTKIFSILALGAALTAPAFATTLTPVLPLSGINPAEVLMHWPTESQGITISVDPYSDPFNPLPHATPISRTRFEVFVTDEMTQCPRIWGALDCPVVVRSNGTREGMVIGNYTHTGPRNVLVERIEYSSSVTVTDAWPLHFVAVED